MAKPLFFIKELIVVMGRDPPEDKGPKNILDPGTSWKIIDHRKWPLWEPSLRSNGQKFIFVKDFTGIVVAIGSSHSGTLPDAK
jgi:hypothetical protein